MNHYYARNIFTFQENSMMTLLPFLMLGLATFAYAQKDMDPVRNMCYRFWHQCMLLSQNVSRVDT